MLKKKMLLLIIIGTLLFPMAANASIFYDLSGSTKINWTLSGVSISGSSATTDPVDLIQVITEVYINGYYDGFRINSASDSQYVYVTPSRNYTNVFYQAYSQHNATDWTGNEETFTYDSFNR